MRLCRGTETFVPKIVVRIIYSLEVPNRTFCRETSQTLYTTSSPLYRVYYSGERLFISKKLMILDSTTRSYPGFFLRRGRQLGSPALVVVGRVAWELGMGNSVPPGGDKG